MNTNTNTQDALTLEGGETNPEVYSLVKAMLEHLNITGLCRLRIINRVKPRVVNPNTVVHVPGGGATVFVQNNLDECFQCQLSINNMDWRSLSLLLDSRLKKNTFSFEEKVEVKMPSGPDIAYAMRKVGKKIAGINSLAESLMESEKEVAKINRLLAKAQARQGKLLAKANSILAEIKHHEFLTR